MSKCRTVVLIKIEMDVSGSSWKGRVSPSPELVEYLKINKKLIEPSNFTRTYKSFNVSEIHRHYTSKASHFWLEIGAGVLFLVPVYCGYTHKRQRLPSATSQAFFSWVWYVFLISLSLRIFSSARVRNISLTGFCSGMSVIDVNVISHLNALLHQI